MKVQPESSLDIVHLVAARLQDLHRDAEEVLLCHQALPITIRLRDHVGGSGDEYDYDDDEATIIISCIRSSGEKDWIDLWKKVQKIGVAFVIFCLFCFLFMHCKSEEGDS